MEKLNIKNLSLDDLSLIVAELGEPRHRKTQILQWLYQKGVSHFSGMTNLPLALRGKLDERFIITELRDVGSVRSGTDLSRKFLLECDDGSLVETVMMDHGEHQTACISSQVGCPLGCIFCRTAAGGFQRNLRCDEILNQALFLRTGFARPGRRFNIVLMGMGETFLNLNNVLKAVEILNAIDAFALGEKRITISTIGYPGHITRLARSPLKFGLAVSLNAATDEVRRRIMPGTAGIRETVDAAEVFAGTRDTRVTLEYVLIAGINDGSQDARELVKLTSGRPFKINLIPFNEWDGCVLKRPDEKTIGRFIELLLPRAPAVTVRRSHGSDIGAACGQLRAHTRKNRI